MGGILQSFHATHLTPWDLLQSKHGTTTTKCTDACDEDDQNVEVKYQPTQFLHCGVDNLLIEFNFNWGGDLFVCLRIYVPALMRGG